MGQLLLLKHHIFKLFLLFLYTYSLHLHQSTCVHLLLVSLFRDDTIVLIQSINPGLGEGSLFVLTVVKI